MKSLFNQHLAKQMYGANTEEELRDKIYGVRSAIIDHELEKIKSVLDQFEEPCYVEVGVYFGGTFASVLQYLKNTKKVYHCYGIDLFEDLEDETFGRSQTHEKRNKWNILNVAYKSGLTQKLVEMGFSAFTLLKGQSHEMIREIDAKYVNVFFIDGNHTYEQVRLDAEAALSRSHTNSYLIFDNSSNDINPDPQYVALDGGPWKLCEELKNDDRVEFIERVHRCSFFRVK